MATIWYRAIDLAMCHRSMFVAEHGNHVVRIVTLHGDGTWQGQSPCTRDGAGCVGACIWAGQGKAGRAGENPPSYAPTWPEWTLSAAPPDFPKYYKTCAEIRGEDPSAIDKTYTLYLKGDRTKPFRTYCHNMATKPVEYLTVDRPNPSQPRC